MTEQIQTLDYVTTVVVVISLSLAIVVGTGLAALVWMDVLKSAKERREAAEGKRDEA